MKQQKKPYLVAKSITMPPADELVPGTEFNIEFDGRSAFFLFLGIVSKKLKEDAKMYPEFMRYPALVEEMKDVLLNKLVRFDMIPDKKGKEVNIRYNISEDVENKDVVKQRVDWLVTNQPINSFIRSFLNQLIPPKKTRKERQQPGDHNQSRSLAKTLGATVGRDTKQLNLFELDRTELIQAVQKQMEESQDGTLYKEVISKKAGTLAQTLVAEWQKRDKDQDGFARMESLADMADKIGTQQKELKLYLLYLGGYQYPHVMYSDNKVGFMMAKLFDIQFWYRKGVVTLEGKTLQVDTLQMIKDAPIDEIRIRPSKEIMKDLEGRKNALGYVPVRDGFLKVLLELSDMAYKILNHSMSNKPEYKISEDKLLEKNNLNLKDQVKKQGLPRVRKKITEALEELKEKGHFAEYTVPDSTGSMYSWKYTDKYIEFRESAKKEVKEGEKPARKKVRK